MKKILCAVALLATMLGANAQGNIKDIKNIDFYGIDFSHAKVVGMANTPTELLNSLNNINYLFISETKKYDIEKFFDKEAKVDIAMVNDINSKIDPDNLVGTDNSYNLPVSEIPDIIKGYKVEDEGTGLIFIASMLDKVRANGSFYVVFFDKKTKDVLYCQMSNGEARGFGVRNYWAGSIYSILKSWDSSYKNKNKK